MGFGIARVEGDCFSKLALSFRQKSLDKQLVSASDVKPRMGPRVAFGETSFGFRLNLKDKLPERALVVVALDTLQGNPGRRGGRSLWRSDTGNRGNVIEKRFCLYVIRPQVQSFAQLTCRIWLVPTSKIGNR